MIVERIGKASAFGTSLTGLALAMSPCVGLSQQQGAEQEETQVAAAPGEAQQEQPQWNEVRIVHVKGERMGEFEGLLKELSAALSESNLPAFDVWQVAAGELNTYHIVAALESLAQFGEMDTLPMEPLEWANWVNRIESTVDSQELILAEVHPDLSIEPDAQAAGDPPELLMLLSQTVMPGRSQEYETWLREEVLPALRESDIDGVISNRLTFGADNRTWVFAVPIPSWSELGQPSPLHRSMGEQAAEEMLNRGDSMVERSETIVLRARPELSGGGGA